MSKHPKVSRHRVPTLGVRPPDPVEDRYQAEVDHAVSKLTRRYESTRKRLEADERRAERLVNTCQRKRTQDSELAALMVAIEARRAELHEIERLMLPGDYTPAKHRPAPSTTTRQIV